MQLRFPLFVLMIISVIIFLFGCTNSNLDPTPSHVFPEIPSDEDVVVEESAIFPIKLREGNFESIYGWLDEQTILFAFEKDGKYVVSSHNLFNNDSEVIFTSAAPIVNVIIHPERKKLLFHTSPHTHGAEIFITDLQGTVYYTTEIDSYELAFEWYEKDDSQLLITAFFDDWTYQVYLLNIAANQLSEVSHLHPFMKWKEKKTVIEQKWENDLSFFAPLWKTALDENGQSTLILDEVYRFDVFSDYLMAIIIPKDNEKVFEYQFFNPLTERQGVLEMPNLTQYSDWLIPHYDYRPTDHRFISFIPKKHGNADMYNDGFTLIEPDLIQFKEKELLTDVENKPFICAPAGDLCIYGYQFEELLDLKSGKIEPLVVTDSQ